jgi:RNA polymerase sigma-70 factor (ECF subfamily)
LSKTGIALPASRTNHASQNCSTFFNRTNASRLPEKDYLIQGKAAPGKPDPTSLYMSMAVMGPRIESTSRSFFEEAMLPHFDAAHNLAKWLLRNEEDAKDVVQEAYLRAFRSFGGFRGSNGRAWLLTIVRNTSYTLLKKNRVVDFTTTFDEEIHVSGDESVSPATILERSEDADLVREAMDDLPAEFREILALRHLEGLSYKEIADIVQIPPGTVMSRLSRARAKLKECLAAHIGKEK